MTTTQLPMTEEHMAEILWRFGWRLVGHSGCLFDLCPRDDFEPRRVAVMNRDRESVERLVASFEAGL